MVRKNVKGAATVDLLGAAGSTNGVVLPIAGGVAGVLRMLEAKQLVKHI